MTPRELDFFHQVLEKLGKHFYDKGYIDAKAGRERVTKFTLSRADKMALKTLLDVHVRENRRT